MLVLVATLSGCGVGDLVTVDAKPQQVNVKGFPLDLAFGKDPVPPAAQRRPTGSTDPVRPPSTGGLFDEVVEPYDPRGEPSPQPPPPARPECPPVGPNTVALRPITTDVAAPVDPGVYTFQQRGVVDVVGLGKLPLNGLTARTVRNLVVDPPDTEGRRAFSYDLELTTGVRRQVQGIRVVPGDGIFLTGIATTANGETSTFSPVLPVEIFPLPASELAQVNSAGLDPLTGETLVVNASVKQKVRVDGCDEVVDGWLVEATWTFQRGPASQVYDIDYVVATQHGGLVVADRLKTTESFGAFQATIDVDSAFGSITPRPEKRTT